MIRRGGSDEDAARDRSLERDGERERRSTLSRRRLRKQHSEERLDAQMRTMSVGAPRCYACDELATGERDLRAEGGELEQACDRHADPAGAEGITP
ncbi:MAG: hypothetical protein ACTHU0_18405 [Kofleriaceae bacterium]